MKVGLFFLKPPITPKVVESCICSSLLYALGGRPGLGENAWFLSYASSLLTVRDR